jgi:predicted AlkP superfamily pyrophosphatase or phosphodiesterase
MHKTVVLNVVGLVPSLVGPLTPRIKAFVDRSKTAHVDPVIPAVTATGHATYLTGKLPAEHGAVGNGWYFRDRDEVKFWRQSNRLVEAPKIWDVAKEMDPTFTCANMSWWFNMNSTVDYLLTPRPMYPSDGRKIPDCYTKPMGMRDELQAELGQFPLFNFWGANASIVSTKWIADASKIFERKFSPTLTLVYLPHLDYCLQKHGPDLTHIAKDLQEIDEVTGDLIEFYENAGARVIVVSEYGIMPVSKPVHLNRVFREEGWLSWREELGREMIDVATCTAFAVADHQIAHIYVNDPAMIEEVKRATEATDGVARVLDEAGKREMGLDHERSGELVVLAEPDAWFTYYYWVDDAKAPDFARTVDIHQKPGYDPAELFFDPADKYVKARAGLALAKKKLGFRSLLEIVPLDASYVKGSHGIRNEKVEDGPMLVSSRPDLLAEDTVSAPQVFDVILRHLTEA